MDIKKITNTLGVNFDESISKIDKLLEQKQDIQHDNIEDTLIEFANDLVEVLSPKELAVILAIKTVEDVMRDQVKDFLTMVANTAVKQSKSNDSNTLGRKLGL